MEVKKGISVHPSTIAVKVEKTMKRKKRLKHNLQRKVGCLLQEKLNRPRFFS